MPGKETSLPGQRKMTRERFANYLEQATGYEPHNKVTDALYMLIDFYDMKPSVVRTIYTSILFEGCTRGYEAGLREGKDVGYKEGLKAGEKGRIQEGLSSRSSSLGHV